jgi:hypothetical protein
MKVTPGAPPLRRRSERPVYRGLDYDTKETVAYLERRPEGELLVTKRVEEQVTAGWLREDAVAGPTVVRHLDRNTPG